MERLDSAVMFDIGPVTVPLAVRPVNVGLSPSAVALRDLVLVFVLVVPVPDSVIVVVMPVVVLSLGDVSDVSE